MKALVVCLGAATVCLIGGCGASGGESVPSDASAELEIQIARQLPSENRRLTGSAGYVRNVDCVHGNGSAYRCIATVSGPNLYGEYVTERLSIEGTCDEKKCLWSTVP